MQLTLPTGAVVHIGRDAPKLIAAKRAKHLQKLDELKSSIAKSSDLDAITNEAAAANQKINLINDEANALADLLAFRANNVKAIGNYLSAIDTNDAILKRVHLEPELIHAARTLKSASAYYGDTRRSIGNELVEYADELDAIATAVATSASKSKALLRVIEAKMQYHLTKSQHVSNDVAQLTKLHGGNLKRLQEQTVELEALRQAALGGDYEAQLKAAKLHPEVLALRKSLALFIEGYNEAQMAQKQEVAAQFKYEITAYRANSGMREKSIDLTKELEGEIV